MNNPHDVWEAVVAIMEKDMTKTTLGTWFDEITALALEENCLVLYTPSAFKKGVIESRYTESVKSALFELFSTDFDLRILTEQESELYKPGRGMGGFLPGTERYTFDRFVVGNSNKFAHAAAVSVANKPAASYNPLFIYGDSGLGKTHLLYAIAHTIRSEHPDYRIVYIRGDAFTNELIHAIGGGRNHEFREKYRSADVFLMDDVQFIAGRDSTQEEMFHTFNTLYEARKQIVFTADRPPKEMLRLEDRLRTRFEWGLLADILPPDYETRMAIIRSKARRFGVELPEEVLNYVAESITANVRQIEGTVNKILAYRDLMGSSDDTATVLRAVRDMFQDPSEFLPSAEVIMEEVCKFYSLEHDYLTGQARTKEATQARQVAMYLIRNMTSLSLKEIGRAFDNRDHSTVLHSIDRVEKLKKRNPEVAEILKDIKTNINARYE